MLRIACLHVPDLALQAVLRERFGAPGRGSGGWRTPQFNRDNIALALFSGPEERRRIVSCTTLAHDCGVQPGLNVAAARGACPELVLVEADPEHAAEALGVLADAVGVFGPTVSLAPPDRVLIDTTGVCGVEITGAAFLEVAAGLGFSARAAIATTPFAAMALASHGAFNGPAAPPDAAAQRRAVERLPLAAAHLPAAAYEALHVVGIRTVGAFMALPAVSLARRFGGAVRHIWRQAHGRAVPRLCAYEPDRPISERSRHEDAPIEQLDPLCFSLKTLLDRALKRLAGRAVGAEELSIAFQLTRYEDEPQLNLGVRHPPDPRPGINHILTLDLGHPTSDGPLLLQLLRERLALSPPPGPVEHIELTIVRASSMAATQLDLFGDRTPDETIQTTVARLAAIMGSEACFTPELRADYRPEYAWDLIPFRAVQPTKKPPETAAPPPATRPARLIGTPTPLPDLRTEVSPPGAVSGPERLVCGWWDGDPVARDYWVLADRWGRRSWVFRDISTDRWFLHGHFD